MTLEPRSSEQTAFALYGQLDKPRRAVVRAWVGLGNDWATSLMNARVLDSRFAPKYPPIVDRVEEWRHGELPPASVRARRNTSEHEACHAVTAIALGATRAVITIGSDGSGLCDFGSLPRAARAAATIAPRIWFELFRGQRVGFDVSCDMADLAADALDGFEEREAADTARRILRDHRAEVLQLADRLERENKVVYSDPEV